MLQARFAEAVAGVDELGSDFFAARAFLRHFELNDLASLTLLAILFAYSQVGPYSLASLTQSRARFLEGIPLQALPTSLHTVNAQAFLVQVHVACFLAATADVLTVAPNRLTFLTLRMPAHLIVPLRLLAAHFTPVGKYIDSQTSSQLLLLWQLHLF